MKLILVIAPWLLLNAAPAWAQSHSGDPDVPETPSGPSSESVWLEMALEIRSGALDPALALRTLWDEIERGDLEVSPEQKGLVQSTIEAMEPDRLVGRLAKTYGVEEGTPLEKAERVKKSLQDTLQEFKTNQKLSVKPEESGAVKRELAAVENYLKKLESTPVKDSAQPSPASPNVAAPRPDGRSEDGTALTIGGTRYDVLRHGDGRVVEFPNLSTGGTVTYFGTRQEGYRFDSAANTLERFVGDALGEATLEQVGFVNPATGLFQRTMDSILRLPEPYNPVLSSPPTCQGRCRFTRRRWSR